ncbi:hydroxyphenylacetyl-CoA thioesterase PaaI [Marinobacter lutaoensis]|jgi:acyl-CoA thioesterase|uniref:Phenylacetic acid degradation protein PaaD n=1 Tax=Marinobacter lutaoensis TaxID=135739 RepID=A0A1V2DQP9_9GAMM|nr:hydroxyphenylacetyl-CoA thioesterase PaaI [Marinobacter lutaoensis]MBE01520.1 phenylacetic acid degradation protein PaaD [Marinobacter sp.]MBI43700.1 phenylacetic acid degradation protein PaaD [Oceanospirillales bacterium]NVD35264.1 hydroxyphenylacetyl-CoA thioesterase PaaI [Marinobacter lutaoensis]ONF42706.1 phenylacetic acid degradation protein PaaD [Marinobacter lutaoensis]|tara:strand:+ start:244 stop:690 length:447 start_codon:yes stop_codon:yes gene_type:complete
MSDHDPQALAEACAAAMFARDRASQKLGMRIESVGPGRAVLTMKVTADMIQGHGSCHGGYLFTLADSAFAFACNSYDRATVASGCTIDYMYGAREGDLLTATAEERARGGRTGVYDITLTNQDGRTVALFRGRSYEVRGTVRNPEDNS